MSRDVPVSATKYPKPSYNKLRFEVRLMASVIKTKTYMFKSLLELQAVSVDGLCYKERGLRGGR